MNGTIKQRIFYLESNKSERAERKGWPIFLIKASEDGKQLNEYRNGQISQYYQADIFGVLAVVSELINEGWYGTAIFYISSKLIVEEHEGNPEQGWYGFKDAQTNDLKDSIKYLDKREKRRWWYSALAHYKARENGINLIIRHLEKRNIKLVNEITSQLLKNSRND